MDTTEPNTKNEVALEMFELYEKRRQASTHFAGLTASKFMDRGDVAKCLGVDYFSVSFAYFVAVANLVRDLETRKDCEKA